MDVDETPQASAEKEEVSDEGGSKDEGDSKAEALSPAAKIASRPKVEYVRISFPLNFVLWF